MKKRRVSLYLKDILEYMERSENYFKGLSKDEFFHDNKVCDSLIRSIEVIGEASNTSR